MPSSSLMREISYTTSVDTWQHAHATPCTVRREIRNVFYFRCCFVLAGGMLCYSTHVHSGITTSYNITYNRRVVRVCVCEFTSTIDIYVVGMEVWQKHKIWLEQTQRVKCFDEQNNKIAENGTPFCSFSSATIIEMDQWSYTCVCVCQCQLPMRAVCYLQTTHAHTHTVH